MHCLSSTGKMTFESQKNAAPKDLVQAVGMEGPAGFCMLFCKLSLDLVQKSEGYLSSKLLIRHHQICCNTTPLTIAQFGT